MDYTVHKEESRRQISDKNYALLHRKSTCTVSAKTVSVLNAKLNKNVDYEKYKAFTRKKQADGTGGY
jgi:hypothetical protein